MKYRLLESARIVLDEVMHCMEVTVQCMDS